MKTGTWLLIWLLFPMIAMAQGYRITGKVIEQTSQRVLPGAGIILTNSTDSADQHAGTSDLQGNFSFGGLRPQTAYRLKLTMIGFQDVDTVIVLNNNVNLGRILMKQTPHLLEEVVVQGQAPPAVQKGDTTEMNASAFKVNQDANAQELVEKMPGITIENGTIKAHGEDVKRVMIDGKNYFGEDPAMALQNLPAEVIDKVQVYNKMSDQAEFTGFDDGQSSKVINIITRVDRRNGSNGLFSAGKGLADKYMLNGRYIQSSNQERFAITGGSNNINQQNFSMQDLIGNQSGGQGGQGGFGGRAGQGGQGGGRGGRGGPGGQGGQQQVGGGFGGSFGGRQSGINTTHSIGLNYTNVYNKKLGISGSYFFNYQDNNTDQLTTRQIFQTPADLYNNITNTSTNKNLNHRFDLRVEYSIDSSNSVIWAPRFYIQNNNRNQGTQQLNYYLLNNPTLSSIASNEITGNAINYTSDLTFRHKFTKPGRTISLGVTVNGGNLNNDGTQISTTASDTSTIRGIMSYDTTFLNQQSNSRTNNFVLTPNLAYTEPIGRFSLLQLSTSATFNTNNTEKYSYNQLLGAVLDTSLSNVYRNSYNTYRGGLSYMIRGGDKLTASVGVDYQYADLTGRRRYPTLSNVDKTFDDYLPNAFLTYKASQKANLRLMYRTFTNPPSINNLQDVLDVSNPTAFRLGNPNLEPEYRHFGVLNYRYSNPDKFINYSVNFFGTYILRSIGNSTYIMSRDTVIRGQSLNKTGQLIMPVNVGDAWNVRTFINYGILVKPLKCNFNFVAGAGYTRTPGLLNNHQSLSNAYTFTGGLIIASNISQNVDFTINYNGNFTNAQNNLQESLNTNSWTHNISLRSNFTWKGIVLQNTLTQQINTGLSAGYNQNFVLWNLSLGRKFLKNNSGDLRIGVVDLLNQNNNISRNVTDISIDDSRTNALQRYYMVSFTYNLRNYKAPTDDHDHFGRGMRPF